MFQPDALLDMSVPDWLGSLNLSDLYSSSFQENFFASMDRVANIWDDELVRRRSEIWLLFNLHNRDCLTKVYCLNKLNLTFCNQHTGYKRHLIIPQSRNPFATVLLNTSTGEQNIELQSLKSHRHPYRRVASKKAVYNTVLVPMISINVC